MAQSRMMRRRTTVLPLVKAYPNLSRKYREVACVAGIDLKSHELVRIYPIPFRFLDEHLQFKKYQPIEVELGKRSEDKRPESWGVVLDSLRVIGDPIDIKDDWEKGDNSSSHLLTVRCASFRWESVPIVGAWR